MRKMQNSWMNQWIKMHDPMHMAVAMAMMVVVVVMMLMLMMMMAGVKPEGWWGGGSGQPVVPSTCALRICTGGSSGTHKLADRSCRCEVLRHIETL